MLFLLSQGLTIHFFRGSDVVLLEGELIGKPRGKNRYLKLLDNHWQRRNKRSSYSRSLKITVLV